MMILSENLALNKTTQAKLAQYLRSRLLHYVVSHQGSYKPLSPKYLNYKVRMGYSRLTYFSKDMSLQQVRFVFDDGKPLYFRTNLDQFRNSRGDPYWYFADGRNKKKRHLTMRTSQVPESLVTIAYNNNAGLLSKRTVSNILSWIEQWLVKNFKELKTPKNYDTHTKGEVWGDYQRRVSSGEMQKAKALRPASTGRRLRR